MQKQFGLGLIGTGFMGECHALAFSAAPAVFGLPSVRMEIVADIDQRAADAAARRFGFARATTDWQALVADPAVDIVAITAPNVLHKHMALAAIAAGKHIYCEKPMALSLDDARTMAAAAQARGVKTLVGYNYMRSPAIALTRKLIEDGEIGSITYFRGLHEEDYMADASTPFSWRCRRDQAGSGTLGDMGSHIISLALTLLGPVESVSADIATVITERPMPAAGGARESRTEAVAVTEGVMAPVENEDIAHTLLRFSRGCVGTLTTSRVAWGRKNRLAFEIFGSKGSIVFDQERFNELQLFTRDGVAPALNGFRTILTGPAHPPYGQFSPAAGHGIGFNDLKIIEVAHLLAALANDTPLYPSFADALQVETVITGMLQSADTRQWVNLAQL
jgi:predicted dehydrogenase